MSELSCRTVSYRIVGKHLFFCFRQQVVLDRVCACKLKIVVLRVFKNLACSEQSKIRQGIVYSNSFCGVDLKLVAGETFYGFVPFPCIQEHAQRLLKGWRYYDIQDVCQEIRCLCSPGGCFHCMLLSIYK